MSGTSMSSRRLPPVHPGEVLLHDFMQPMGVTKYRLAKEIHVPATRIGEIIAGRRGITPDTDLRLSKFFGVSRGIWLGMQAAYDLENAESQLEAELASIVQFKPTRRARRAG